MRLGVKSQVGELSVGQRKGEMGIIEPIWYLFQANLASEVASISSNFQLGNDLSELFMPIMIKPRNCKADD